MTRARTLALTAAVVAPVVVGALLTLVRDLITNNNAALVLVLVVVAVAASGDRLAGLVAAVVSAASFDFFLTQPYLTFTINDRDDVEAAVLLALIGLAVTEIALWGRRQQARASTRAGYLEGVVAAAQLAASGTTSPSDVVELVGRQIGVVLDLDACVFDPGPSDPGRPRLEAERGHHLAGPCRRRGARGPADARPHRAARDLRGCRARALPADLDQRGAPARPGTPPGRRHARRPGGRGPRRSTSHRRRPHGTAAPVLTAAAAPPSARGRRRPGRSRCTPRSPRSDGCCRMDHQAFTVAWWRGRGGPTGRRAPEEPP